MSTTTLLSLRNGDEQVTINFDVVDAINTSPNFTGYHLVSYQGQPPPVETARNSSLYIDGSTIVNYKAANVVETIVIDIVGNSVDDAFDKLRALERFVWSARDYHTAPNSRIPSRIAYIPFGGSRTVYAVVFNGQVNETTASGRAKVDGNRIRNISVTIEREPYWRQLEPNENSFNQPYQFVDPGNTRIYQSPRWWGVLSFNATPGGLLTPGGDVPALVKLGVTPNNLFNLSRAVVGYVSQKRNAIPGYTIPTAPLLYEAESFVIDDAVHGTRQFVTTASPYTGGGGIDTAVRITTATVYGLRLHTTINLGLQSCRVFARMRVIPFGVATTVSVNITQQAGAVASDIGPAVFVSSAVTEWAMYDMGVFTPPQEVATEWRTTPITFALGVGVYTQHITGTENLEIDCLILIPCDEYYLDMACVPQTIDQTKPAMSYNNIMVPNTTVGNVSGSLYIPPGNGVLYYLAGWDNFQNSWDPITTPTSPVELNLLYTERYGSVRGS